MARLRLAIKKAAALVFLSHLDYAEAVRRVLVRARIPIAYSEGFNPHMKLNFASALGVGVTADVEYMDIILAEDMAPEEVKERINRNSPEGFEVTDVVIVSSAAPKLMAICNFATYELRGPLREDISTDELQRRLDVFNGEKEVTYEKVTPKIKRLIQVKDHVTEPVKGYFEEGQIVLECSILYTAQGGIKPLEVWQLLGERFHIPVQTEQMLARRTGLYVKRGDELLSPLDIREK